MRGSVPPHPPGDRAFGAIARGLQREVRKDIICKVFRFVPICVPFIFRVLLRLFPICFPIFPICFPSLDRNLGLLGLPQAARALRNEGLSA